MRSISIGLGQQRNSLSTWSWRGWSGCAQQKLLGVESTISAEPSAGFFLGRRKGLVIEHVSLGQATGKDTEEELQQKGCCVARAVVLGGPPGGRDGSHRVRYSWDFPSQEVVAPTLRKAATCGEWAFLTRVMVVFNQESNATSSQCFGYRFGASLEGMAHGFSKVGLDHSEVGGLAGPELLVKEMGTWLPLLLDPRSANAKQLADQEDWGELLPRPSLEEVDAVCKTYKSTAGLDTSTPRLFCSSLSNCECAFRFAHGVRVQAGQALVLGTHVGVEAQAIRGASHIVATLRVLSRAKVGVFGVGLVLSSILASSIVANFVLLALWVLGERLRGRRGFTRQPERGKKE